MKPSTTPLLPKRVRPVLLAAIGCAAISTSAQAAIVSSGWSLFTSGPTTQIDFSGTPYAFLGIVEFQRAPLTVFDFGGTTGVQPTGNNDTIIRRGGDAEEGRDRRGGGDTPSTNPNVAEIDIELVALSLQSVSPTIDLTPVGGPATGPIRIDLSSDAGSTMAINFADNTVDIEMVALSLVQSGAFIGPDFMFNLELLSQPWLRTVDPSIITPALIPGVNFQLNGADDGEDIFLQGKAELEDPGNPNTTQTVHDGGIPEPSSSLLAGLAGLLLLVLRNRR